MPQLKSNTVNLIFKEFDEAVEAYNRDDDLELKCIVINPVIYESWRIDGGEPAYEVVRVRRGREESR